MIKVLKQDLVKALGLVKSAVAVRPTLPVLSHVALVSYKDKLVVMGTNLETFVEVSIHCHADEEEVSICVPNATFSKYVAALEDEAVYLGSNATMLAVEQGKSNAEFPGISYEEFPLIPVTSDKNKIQLDVDTLGYAFGSVLHAAAADESRPILTGVFVKYDGDQLITVCADGFRMAVTNTHYNQTVAPFQLVVPAQGIDTVLRSLPEEGEAHLWWDETRLCIDLPYDGNIQTKVYCHTIQGSYVNYTQIIPAKATAFTITRDVLVKAIKRCAVFANQEANVIHFTPSGDELTLDGKATDAGEGIEKVAIGYEGEEITFALNSAFTLQSLATCGDVIEIEASTPSRPIVISSERDNHLCVLMPMAVRNK
jgi:DNA polymerase-3 subunit beta